MQGAKSAIFRAMRTLAPMTTKPFGYKECAQGSGVAMQITSRPLFRRAFQGACDCASRNEQAKIVLSPSFCTFPGA